MARLTATVQPPDVVIAINADGNAFASYTVTPPPITYTFDAPGYPGTEYDGVANFVASAIGVTLTELGGGEFESGSGGGGGSSEGGGGGL